MSDSADEHYTRDGIARMLHATLDADTSRRLHAHLRGCPDCQKLADTVGPLTLDFVPTLDYYAGRPAPAEEPARLVAIGGYEVLSVIARGGMGTVYLARHRLLRRLHALKVGRFDAHSTPADQERFIHEMCVTASLVHPNIVRVHDGFVTDGMAVMAMEYVPGLTLAEAIRERGSLPLAEACDYALQVLKALDYAARYGVTHGDIKPSNIILQPDGGSFTVRLIDFGLCWGVGEADPDEDESRRPIIGTPAYMPPERCDGGRANDPRGDLYSLGSVLYELLTGSAAFRSSSLVEMLHARRTARPPILNDARPDLPRAVSNIVARMMALDPDDRYQTYQEVVECLAAFSSRPVPPKRAVTAWERWRAALRIFT